MAFHGFSTNCEANARAVILATTMQTLKWFKQAIDMFRSDADAVVRHGEFPVIGVQLGSELNLWLPARWYELHGVCDEILIHLSDQSGVCRDTGQRAVTDLRSGVVNANL